MNEYKSAIMKGENLRENMILLKNSLNEGEELKDDRFYLQLKNLLQDGDPKIRKNAALLLGYFHKGSVRQDLLNGYYNEAIDFVKPAYLKGLSMHNCKPIVEDLKAIQQSLLSAQDVDTKHIQAQLKVLNPLIRSYSSHKKKMVRLLHKDVDVILTTLPYYQFTLFDYVKGHKYKPVGRGVLVRTNSVYDLLPFRNYHDMIIPIRNCAKMPFNADIIVDCFKKSNLLELLDNLFDSNGSFYYKISNHSRHTDVNVIQNVIKGLLVAYPEKLLNVTRNYEIEIVLEDHRNDLVNAYLKLSQLDNPRFDYRKEVISNSMQPYVAATLLELAKPYTIPHARVLDPFCGSGVTLIERCLMKHPKFALGIDIYAKGLDAAKRNSKAAGLQIHYINKNALRFVNSEKFDEIVTDMPTLAQMKDGEELRLLYDGFFKRIHRHVRPGGYIFIYTSEIALIEKNLRLQHDYLSLIEHYDVPRGKSLHYFFIIQRK